MPSYGFDETSLKVIILYLKNCTQTTKVGTLFSELLNIIYGVPQQWSWSFSIYYIFL